MGGAFVIGQITIKDEAKWEAYRREVPATLLPWGGEVMARGRLARELDGQCSGTDRVVIRFPDVSRATGWHASAAYQALIPLRKQAADIDLACFEE